MKTKNISLFGLLGVLLLSACGPTPGESISQEPVSMDSEGNIIFNDVQITYGNPITGSDGNGNEKTRP